MGDNIYLSVIYFALIKIYQTANLYVLVAFLLGV